MVVVAGATVPGAFSLKRPSSEGTPTLSVRIAQRMSVPFQRVNAREGLDRTVAAVATYHRDQVGKPSALLTPGCSLVTTLIVFSGLLLRLGRRERLPSPCVVALAWLC